MTPLWLLEQEKEAPISKYLFAVFAPPGNKAKTLRTTTDPISNRSGKNFQEI